MSEMIFDHKTGLPVDAGRVANRDLWDSVDSALAESAGICWDGSHKIYVLMDDAEVERMREYGFGNRGTELISLEDDTVDFGDRVREWFEASGDLRFISGSSSADGPREIFTLIPQFAETA
ncbi:hypothetical protein E0W80_09490 [Microbacterium sp. PI-1]|uniref:hypothetical protein n=1 Tax=unclassified Microbacterium TaxID=2609290 RepID=UPI00103B0CB0|nr:MULTISPECIES: hypothetical protein [unclassified Microbacterium]TCJ23783.1 hypothetical protein E0W80_09490 [Microbacterium sp. PI-1]UUE20078.1 hypothetical protein LRQ07_14965 [Microbacterium sp. J1-1]